MRSKWTVLILAKDYEHVCKFSNSKLELLSFYLFLNIIIQNIYTPLSL